MNEKLRKILKRKKEIRAKLNAQIEGTIELTDEDRPRSGMLRGRFIRNR